MSASARSVSAPKTWHTVLRILGASCAIFGMLTFGASGSGVLWLVRAVFFGIAISAFALTLSPGDASGPLALTEESVRIGRRRIDPAKVSAAAFAEVDGRAVLHWFTDRSDGVLLTPDAALLPILRAAIQPTIMEAPREYASTGTLATPAVLTVDRTGLSWGIDWKRGQGFTNTERLAWKDIDRVSVSSGFLLIDRADGSQAGPGVSVAPDLERTLVAEIESMRPAPRPAFPAETAHAIVQHAETISTQPSTSAPFRAAPEVTSDVLREALVCELTDVRIAAARLLVARGEIPAEAVAFIRRGLEVS